MSFVTLGTSSYAFRDSLLRRGPQAAPDCWELNGTQQAENRNAPLSSSYMVTASANDVSAPRALMQILSGPDFSTAF